MKISKNVLCGQCYGSLIRIQIRYTAIFLGQGWIAKGWQGLAIGIFAPAHNPEKGYRCVAFYCSMLPALPGPVSQWPKWYRWIHGQLKSYRTLIKGFA